MADNDYINNPWGTWTPPAGLEPLATARTNQANHDPTSRVTAIAPEYDKAAASGTLNTSYARNYDLSILKQDADIQDTDFEKNVSFQHSWLKASHHTYEMMEGTPPPGNMSDQELIEWGQEFMLDYETGMAEWSTELINPLNWFNSDDIGGSIGTDRKAEKATPQQKEALRYLKDAYDKYDLGAWDSTRYVLETFASPENIAMLPAGLLGKGAQIGWNVAKGGLQAIRSTGLKTAWTNAKAVAGPVTSQYGFKAGAIEGTAFAAVDANHRLDTDVTIGRETEFRYDLFAQQVAMGAVAGGAGAHYIPKVVSWAGRKLSSAGGGAVNATNTVRGWFGRAPTTVSVGKVIGAPQRTWMHRVAWAAGQPWRWVPMAQAADPSDWLPNDLVFGKYIHGFIAAVDDQIVSKDRNMITAFNSLNDEVERIALKTSDGGVKIEDAKNQVKKVINTFRTDNETKLQEFAKSLDPLIDEIKLEKELAELAEQIRREEGGKTIKTVKGAQQVRDTANSLMDAWERKSGKKLTASGRNAHHVSIQKGGAGRFRLEARQVTAMHNYIIDLKETATKLADQGSDFSKSYERDFDKILDMKGEENATAIGQAIRESLWSIKKLTGNTNQAKSADAAQRIQDRPYYTVRRFIPKWLGGTMGMRTNKIEDLDAQMRMFDVGYYNPNRRVAGIKEFADRDNAERFAILIEMAREVPEVKEGKQTIVEYLDGQARTLYNAGREWEYLKAIQRLQWQTGRGTENKIPQNLSNSLGSDKDRPDVMALRVGKKADATDQAHFTQFLNGVEYEEAWMPHSPYAQDQRHTYDLFVRWSNPFWHGKRFAGTNEVGTPFKDDVILKTRNRWVTQAKAYLFGGYTVPSSDPKNPVPQIRWLPESKDGETRGWTATLAESAKIPVRLAWNWATLPFRPAIIVTKPLFNNIVAKKVGMGLGVGGVALAATEGLAENTITPERDTWITNEEGNLVVPFTDTDLDFGNRAVGLGLGLADLGLAPLRGYTGAVRGLWNSDTMQGMVKKKFGSTAPIDLELEKYFSLDAPGLSVMELNKHYLGDRGGAEIKTVTSEFQKAMDELDEIAGRPTSTDMDKALEELDEIARISSNTTPSRDFSQINARKTQAPSKPPPEFMKDKQKTLNYLETLQPTIQQEFTQEASSAPPEGREAMLAYLETLQPTGPT